MFKKKSLQIVLSRNGLVVSLLDVGAKLSDSQGWNPGPFPPHFGVQERVNCGWIARKLSPRGLQASSRDCLCSVNTSKEHLLCRGIKNK